MLQPAGLEGEADQEVNQIIEELTAAALAPAADAPTKKPAGPAVWMYLVLYSMWQYSQVAAASEEVAAAAEDDELDAELQAMRDRLQAL